MIIQQVNLYQENRKPERLNTDNFVYLAVIVIFILILAGFSVYFQSQLLKSQKLVTQTQKSLETQKAAVKQLQDSLPKPQANTALIDETRQWQKKITDLTQAISILENETEMQSQGFSRYFLALANQSVSEIWLRVIHFDAGQDLIDFEGSTFSSDEIPVFLQRLQKEPAFHGRSFAKLTVDKSATSELMNFKLSTQLLVLKKNHAE